MLAELKEKFVKKKPMNTLSNIFLRKIHLECIQKKENYDVEYKGKVMTLTPEELKTKCVGRKYIAEPKFGDRPYHLLSYLWEPIKTT
jgi:hypothetical protein